MHIVVVIDSFKGSLSSLEAGYAVKEAAARLGLSDVTVIPVADGGEGTVEALIPGLGGSMVEVTVTGPLGEPVKAAYGIVPERGLAVMEIAAAAGLPLVPEARRDPMETTTYGVGELIRDAVGRGCRDFLIGLGGSATSDGGLGMLAALGFAFTDKDGRPAGVTGRSLGAVAGCSVSGAMPALAACTFRVACDVTNPLYGPAGAAAVFAPQKGATPAQVEALDRGLRCLAAVVQHQTGTACATLAGAGAAGGLGYAFAALLGASLQPGIDVVLDGLRVEEAIAGADLVITGEGRLDAQTSMGKLPAGVAARAKRYGKPVVALCGCVAEGAADCHAAGIDAYFPILRTPMTLDQAMDPDRARANLRDTADQVLRLFRLDR